MATSIEQTNLE